MRDPVAGRGSDRDWVIRLEPVRGDGGVWLEILPAGCDEVDAAAELEVWADTFEKYGRVPRVGVIAVTGRAGLFCFRVRCDSFERETESGSSSGAGFLRAVSVPRED